MDINSFLFFFWLGRRLGPNLVGLNGAQRGGFGPPKNPFNNRAGSKLPFLYFVVSRFDYWAKPKNEIINFLRKELKIQNLFDFLLKFLKKISIS